MDAKDGSNRETKPDQQVEQPPRGVPARRREPVLVVVDDAGRVDVFGDRRNVQVRVLRVVQGDDCDRAIESLHPYWSELEWRAGAAIPRNDSREWLVRMAVVERIENVRKRVGRLSAQAWWGLLELSRLLKLPFDEALELVCAESEEIEAERREQELLDSGDWIIVN